MSAPHIMGSHGNFPFGYDPNHIHGIGLPSYINPQQQPQPQGQPLLNEQENNDMSNFFSDFEVGNQAHDHSHSHGHAPNMMAHYDHMPQLQPLQMPPQTYVGHETSLQSPHAMDWHHQQNSYGYTGMPNHHTQSIPQPQSPYDNNHQMTSPVHSMFPMHQNNAQTYTTNWQQSFPPNHLHSRPDLHFGTDQNFVNSGYIAPEGGPENDMSILYNVMGPTSTPSTTQPNTRPPTQPNTEPSSPVTNKKRKLNDFHDQARLPNGAAILERRVTEPSPRTSRKHGKSFVKHEQPPTPLSKTPTLYGDEEAVEEDDAEYDEDADGESVNQRHSPSPPAPWPASKARPTKVDKPPLSAKSSKSRKKSMTSVTSRPSKPHRTSSGTLPNISRTPLTAEQKKANHTNSEQRRRDATARAYAELYDLVPEIQEMGKQSTMKKLEVVVDKVRDVKGRLEYLRGVIGQDLGGGRHIPAQVQLNNGDMGYLQRWH